MVLTFTKEDLIGVLKKFSLVNDEFRSVLDGISAIEFGNPVRLKLGRPPVELLVRLGVTSSGGVLVDIERAAYGRLGGLFGLVRRKAVSMICDYLEKVSPKSGLFKLNVCRTRGGDVEIRSDFFILDRIEVTGDVVMISAQVRSPVEVES